MPLIPPVARPQLLPIVCIDYVAKHYSNSAITARVPGHSTPAELYNAATLFARYSPRYGLLCHSRGSSVRVAKNMA